MLRNTYPNLKDEHVQGLLPNLSQYFVITQKRTVISKQTTAQLALKNLGKRKVSTELPIAIKVSYASFKHEQSSTSQEMTRVGLT